MSRVIAVVACGFSLAACSSSIPSLNFLSSSPPSEALRFESEPPGAEVKTSAGQACRTPCELTLQMAPELSATFALNGFQSQTVSVRSEGGSTFSSPRFAPNPVYVELRPAVSPAKKRLKKKPPVEAKRPGSSVASAAPAGAPPAAATTAATPAPAPEAAASATNYPWPAPASAR